MLFLLLPFHLISGELSAKLSVSASIETQDAYATAGAVASECFSLVRTFTACESRSSNDMVRNYKSHVLQVLRRSIEVVQLLALHILSYSVRFRHLSSLDDFSYIEVR